MDTLGQTTPVREAMTGKEDRRPRRQPYSQTHKSVIGSARAYAAKRPPASGPGGATENLRHHGPAAAVPLVPLAANISLGNLALIVAGVSLVWLAVLLLSGQRAATRQRRLLSERDAAAEREREARRLAEQDPLTGLGNYRMFWRRVEAEAARARRHQSTFSLVMLDLDGFKLVNDEMGHQAGDEALRHVARALLEALRAEDVVCRQGGDEFAVIGVETGAEQAGELAERLVASIAKTSRSAGLGRRITACAGWATFGTHASTVEDLVLRCDEALRYAKSTRRMSAVAGPGDADSSPLDRVRVVEAHDREGRALQRLDVLAALTRELAGASDERRVVELAAAHLVTALPGTAASIVRFDAERERLEIAALGGWADVELPGAELGVFAGPIRYGSSVLLADVREDPIAESLVAASPDLRSLLIVPVRLHEEIWGALSIESNGVGAYDADDRALAEAMAVEVGRALSCVWAFDALARGGGEERGAYQLAAAVEGAEEEVWRLADLAWRVGRALGLDRDDLRALYLGALFHDVGTLGVPIALLAKPASLSPEERALVNQHPVIAESILRPLPTLREIAPIVRHEHERFDGAGYPDGLAGEAIPFPSRILLPCDAFVAMTSRRAWREPMERDEALTELREARGAQFDPVVVDSLIRVLSSNGNVTVEAPS
jgi:diguanylate cyclase (GGDEF)-like protein